MRIHLWGVRGSLPAPLQPSQIKSKVSAILERLTPADLENPRNRECFLAGLPAWLFGTVGGNTSCVSVRFDDRPDVFVFDAGSGIRELGIALNQEKPRPSHYRLFFSHFHWDHIMGLPFFNPAYDPAVTLDIYSPAQKLEEILRGQMSPPYFPVSMETMNAKKNFHILDRSLELPGVTVSCKKMSHPGDSYAYMIDDGKRRFIYATDTELSAADFIKTDRENAAFFRGADFLIMDAQYTLGEAIEKYNWGHSAFSLAVDFAANWGVKHLVLFHHDPAYDDKKLSNILQSARWYMERMNIGEITISLAMEGTEIVL